MKRSLSSLILTLIFVAMHSPALAQDLTRCQASLTQPQDYVLKRVSSADPSGGNADFRPIEPGGTLTVLDVDGPALLSHIWFTLYAPAPHHLKELVLRMYWDGEGTPRVEEKKNLNGEGNYVWMEAAGRGHFLGVTMSVLQNQDGWWGEGDDMFFIDGEPRPSINGTGSEDYFLGAFDFGRSSFSYRLFGAPVKGEERAGGRSSVYRFHLDSPIPFSKSLRATIEHGHANHRSDSYYSVAYWYQSEPHGPFPPLPPADQRIPRLQPVGGPGNSAVAPH